MVSDSKLTFGIVGLGRIGGNLARQAVEKGMNVVGFTKGGVPRDLLQLGIRDACSIGRFRQELRPSRIIFLYIPAGPVVDEILGQLELVLENSDVIVDGGNSYWVDSIRRQRRLKERGLHFVDLGTSVGSSGLVPSR